MASEMSPDTAAQRKSSLAQHDKRLLVRLAAWGGTAVLSLVAAGVISLTGDGNRRLHAWLSGEPAPSPAAMASATIPLPPADGGVDKRVVANMSAQLAAVARNTAATRAETRRLASQVSKLSADNFSVTGRLANIEHQIDGITGSIKQRAEKAAADAVAKAMPKSPFDSPATSRVFDPSAPVIGAPATTYPRLSLIVPQRANVAPPEAPDVSTTAAITTPPQAGTKDQERVEARAESKAAPEPIMKDEAGKMAPARKPRMTRAPIPEPKPKAKAMAEPPKETPAHPMKMASASPTGKMLRVTVRPGRYAQSLLPSHGYGVDLGTADSVALVNAQWAAVKANFGPMLRGLRPTAVRDHQILSGGYRLVVGRLGSMKAAERLCSHFTSQQVSCQPVTFDDGRVVWQ